MVKRLGEQDFKKLKIRAFQYKKKDDKLALLFIKQLCLNLQKKKQSKEPQSQTNS
jgi:hypothetical protein